MKKAKAWVALLGVALLVGISAYPQARRTSPQAMTKWVGKYPDAKFFNQPPIKSPLRRLLSKADYDSIGDYNLMIPIKRFGNYLVTYAVIKYADPQETLSSYSISRTERCISSSGRGSSIANSARRIVNSICRMKC